MNVPADESVTTAAVLVFTSISTLHSGDEFSAVLPEGEERDRYLTMAVLREFAKVGAPLFHLWRRNILSMLRNIVQLTPSLLEQNPPEWIVASLDDLEARDAGSDHPFLPKEL